MPHACHRCGANVDDGTPFCRQCNAPQIKVVAAEPSLPQEILEAESEPLERLSYQAPVGPRTIDWRNAVPAVFFVAVPAGLLSSSPLSILFFLWTFGAGVISVSTYRKRTQSAVTPGMAARLGLLAGTVAFAIFLIVFLVAMSRPEFRQQLHQQMESRLQSNPDPNIRQAAAILASPDAFATIFTFIIVAIGLLFLFFSVLGAIAAATIFAPKNRAP
jgi:hypothetical protein